MYKNATYYFELIIHERVHGVEKHAYVGRWVLTAEDSEAYCLMK
jgi:hypothetical protein